ncbi:MAG: hypothetical protein LBL91_05400 [Lachnospiraceae bacterium]|nr:hypothetical protein [Lachnospiraceae bacterium]
MKTYIDNDDKIIELWFTYNENPNSIIPPTIDSIIDEYRKLKYKVCLYHSGTEEITPITSALLISNLQQLADRENKEQYEELEM